MNAASVEEGPGVEIPFRAKTLQTGLLCLSALVVSCGLAAEIWSAGLGFDDPAGLVPFFSLSYEENLPTWVASCLLYSCAFLLALIALGPERSSRWAAHWWALSAAFLYISMDETATLHEHASEWFDFGGVLYFGWVLPAAGVVALFGVSYLGFLAALPRRFAKLFVLSGAIYVGGALGVELPLAWWTEQHGSENLVYGLIDWVEESMELAGASLFLYALACYLLGRDGVVRFRRVQELR